MADRPRMPMPARELTPEELRTEIEEWAHGQGYSSEFRPATREFGTIVLTDPAGGHSFTTLHKPHHGRRLRRDQIRHAVKNLNANWED